MAAGARPMPAAPTRQWMENRWSAASRTRAERGAGRRVIVGTATVVAAAAAIGIALWTPMVVVASLVVVSSAYVALRSRLDAASLLSVVVLAAFLVPSRYIVGPLGALGTPSVIAGLAAALWWALARIGSVDGLATGAQPVRTALVCLGAAMLAAYAAGWVRPIVALEGRNADRTAILWLAYGGVALLAADGIGSRDRLETLLRRLVWGATAMGTVALVQWFGGFDPAAVLAPPGLVDNQVGELTIDLFRRGTFVRVAGTALHPIEFAVTAAATVPLAVALAVADRHRSALSRWTPVVVLGCSLPLAISRAGFLGLAAGGALVLAALDPVRRVAIAALGAVSAVAMSFAVPGLAGTIRDWFWAIATDSSITARTSDYRYVDLYVDERPLVGRGFGTFEPSLYDFLDNQYLLSLIESGVIGLSALVLTLVVGIGCAESARRRLDGRAALIARGVTAGVVVHLVAFATYDDLVFPLAGIQLFALLGAAGAIWRLAPAETPAR